MTDQLSGGVVQPTDAQIDALWADERLSTPQIVKRRSIARAVLALAVPQTPLQAEPAQEVLRKVVHYGNCMATGNIMAAEAAMSAVEDALASPAPLQAEPVPVVASPHSATENILRLATECAHKLATPANWHALRSAVEALATPQAEPAAPIYQLRNVFVGESQSTWHDASEKAYDFHPDKDRRIVYATPQAEPAVAEQAREEASIFGAAHLWAQEAYRKGLGKDCDIDGKRSSFKRALRAALASQSTPPPESAGPEPTHWLVMAPCGEGVVFDNRADARWTKTGREEFAQAGRPVIGETFRECYGEEKLTLTPLILAANPTAKPDGGSKA